MSTVPNTRDSSTTPTITGLNVLDDPISWESAGFSVTSGGSDSHGYPSIRLGGFTIRLLGRGSTDGGISGWSLFPHDPTLHSAVLDGIKTVPPSARSGPPLPHAERPSPAAHPNGVISVDHIVVRTGNIDSTVSAFNQIGWKPKRKTSTLRRGVTQVFFREGEVIIELVGPSTAPQPNENVKTAYLWGLTLVSADVDATHRVLSESTRPPWSAVQPGRRMTVLNGAKHDISIPVAIMSPHVPMVCPPGSQQERLLEQRARQQEAELRRRKEVKSSL